MSCSDELNELAARDGLTAGLVALLAGSADRPDAGALQLNACAALAEAIRGGREADTTAFVGAGGAWGGCVNGAQPLLSAAWLHSVNRPTMTCR
jgi:hypothetical protein